MENISDKSQISEDITCFFCKEIITKKEFDENKIEMLTGPYKKKIFSHISHKGVQEEIKE